MKEINKMRPHSSDWDLISDDQIYEDSAFYVYEGHKHIEKRIRLDVLKSMLNAGHQIIRDHRERNGSVIATRNAVISFLTSKLNDRVKQVSPSIIHEINNNANQL